LWNPSGSLQTYNSNTENGVAGEAFVCERSVPDCGSGSDMVVLEKQNFM
jgi:hypothetical protein